MNHFYLRVTPGEKVRIIISVSKKVSPKAVIRNRIRRRVRPIVSKLSPTLKPSNYFVVAKAGSADVKGEELQKELTKLFKL